jgi:multiple sugar transport system permease protein
MTSGGTTEISLYNLAITFAFSVALSLLCSLLPIRAAAKIPIKDTILRTGTGLREGSSIVRFLTGAFMLTVGLITPTLSVFTYNMAVIMLALVFALLLRPITARVRRVLLAFFLLPLVIPSGSIVHFWGSLFGINGVINSMFFTSAPINWLNTDSALLIILFIFMWKNAGFNIVLYLAGLNLIPKEYYEYASVEGAGEWWKFKSVTLVNLTPTFFMVLLMSIIASFKSFREIYLLAGSHPHQSIYMLQHYLNNQFTALNYQRLAASAYILSIGIIGLVVVVFYIQRRVLNNE